MMNRKVFTNFLKDRLAFSVSYFTACLLLILFFHLSPAEKREIIYPAVIAGFIYLLFIVFEFFRYYRFNSKLDKCLKNTFYKLPASTCEQKEMNKLVSGLHDRYVREIGSLKAKEQEYRRFLSQWVHEIKTPVTVTDLIFQKYKRNDTPAQDVVEKVGEENARIFNMLENILDLMKLEEFASDYTPSTVDLVASVKRIINRRKNQFIYSNVFPELQCSSDEVNVLTDSKWNDMILEQLLSNAVKYSKPDQDAKKVFIVIEQSGNRVSLLVKDQGIGIPPHDLRRVFVPFFTGENGRKREGSTGIGLYMCSVIAEKLGHTISVDSEVGVGTTVRVGYLAKM